MPPKQMKDASGSSLVTSWMLPKPKTEEQHNPDHNKTDDKTPSPTEVADSSEGAEEKPGNEQTLSPTEVADSPEIDHEAEWERTIAYNNNGNDNDDYNDGLATDEAAAMAELVQEASLANITLQVLLAVKRPREEEKATVVAAPPEEQPEGSGLSCKP